MKQLHIVVTRDETLSHYDIHLISSVNRPLLVPSPIQNKLIPPYYYLTNKFNNYEFYLFLFQVAMTIKKPTQPSFPTLICFDLP
jgi:hypothetical protein